MKSYFIITLFLSFIMLFLPFLSLSDNFTYVPQSEKITVADETGNVKDKTELSDYLVGVVAAEMPASFHEEALKAQAVAAYSYYKYQKENGAEAIIGSSAVHQGYKTKEELKEFWGDKYDFYLQKIEDAVGAVSGEYLISEGKTVPALYHALSSGVTESAETVFGKEVPSLEGVTSPGDRLSPDYITEKAFTKEEICSLTEFESDNETIEITQSTDSKFVKKILVFGKEYSGTELRTALKLNSPYFTVKKQKEKYIFTVYGKGHGVGMSQYSADYMARQGSSYEEILMHFYSECSIAK